MPKGICNSNKTLCITDIKIKEVIFNSFTISWSVTNGASTYIMYRQSNSQSIMETNAELAIDELTIQTVKELKEKTKYYYKIYATLNTEAVETTEVPITTEEKTSTTGSYCGNGTCDDTEDESSCYADCGGGNIVIPTDGLVAYYPFNGNANDESAYGNDGTVNGTTLTTDRHGNTESAYSFDGVDDFISILSSGTWDFGTTNWTFSIFIKAAENGDFFPIWHVGEGDWVSFYSPFGMRQEFYQNFFRVSSAEGEYNLYDFNLDNSNFDGNWHHLVISRNGINLSQYWDANLIESQVIDANKSIGDSTNNINICFAKFGGGESYYCKGEIDDIRIYNKALSENEIKALYNEGD